MREMLCPNCGYVLSARVVQEFNDVQIFTNGKRLVLDDLATGVSAQPFLAQVYCRDCGWNAGELDGVYALAREDLD